MKKAYIILKKIWADPVWSSVIAALIFLIVTGVIAVIKKLSIVDLYSLVIQFLNFKIPIYLVLSVFGGLFLIRYLYRFFNKRENIIWKEKIGDYTFEELYKILQNQNLPVQTRGMEWANKEAPKEDLLTLFRMYKVYLNMEVTSDAPFGDGGYIYGVLCPKLVSYGIVEKIDYKDSRSGLDMIKYETTEIGHKFYRLVEKVVYITE
jgi:ABC-type multidrug transport system fused ATPase/permease subunit